MLRTSDILSFLTGKIKHLADADGSERSDKPSDKNDQLRVFLSYGHDEYAKVARQVKSDLEQQGFEVWFDSDKVQAGVDWEADIEKGLDWAAEDPEHGRFLLLMTPHSVRRPGGFCLNELARALDRQMMVIPVMISSVEPPLAICRLQWLDLSDSIPIKFKKKRYLNKLKMLRQYIERKLNLENEGSISNLRNTLRPLQFAGDINWHLPRFTGRRWLLGKVNEWLAVNESGRVFLITGLPGCGKTAFASWLISNLPEVAAFHLCRYGYSEKADPSKCIKSIAYQLSTQLPDYREYLIPMLQSIGSNNDPYDLFDKLIIQPLYGNYPHPGRTVVIVIDALDEATIDQNNKLASLIANELPKAPQWLKLIVTSRRDHSVMDRLQGLQTYEIELESKENLEDIREYLRRELADYASPGKSLEDVIPHIIGKSEGLFLYIEKFREEISSGYLSLENIHEFPKGLGGIYHAMFERHFPPGTEDYKINIRPKLDVLAAYPEIDIRMLEALLKWKEHDQNDFLQKMKTFFSVIDNRLKPFHKSLFDWLTDPDRAGDYYISAREGFEIIKQNCDEALSGKRDDRYNYWLARLIRDNTWQYHKDNRNVNNIEYLGFARDILNRSEDQAQYLQVLCDLTRAHFETGKVEEAKIIGENSLKEANKLRDLSARGRLHHTLGRICSALEYYDEAFVNYEKALHDLAYSGDNMGCTAVRRRMADVMVKQGRYKKALTIYQQALQENLHSWHSPLGISLVLSSMGNCYLNMGEGYIEPALSALLAAREVIDRNSIKHREASAENLLNEVEKFIGREAFKKAVATIEPLQGEYAEYILDSGENLDGFIC